MTLVNAAYRAVAFTGSAAGSDRERTYIGLRARTYPIWHRKTVELFSFGRPKGEKLKPHLHPLREVAAPMRSHHSLGTVNQRVNGVNQRPNIANERSATSASNRRTPQSTGERRVKRIAHNSLFWRSRWDKLLPLWSICGPVDGK
ncbi:hypothetical protein Taro_039427 [Colocasia esculenta]|uniref:Uncharacterized protein n=1 Tax=Colocasia esculenta TaxID=4460 RepID=A0A843WVQ8_COLES|nr:hypothetical protein [Colocasia esculenta]